MSPYLSVVTMLLVWWASGEALENCGAGLAPVGHGVNGAYGLPGATGEVSAVEPIRQRRVAAKAGLSSPDRGTWVKRGSPT